MKFDVNSDESKLRERDLLASAIKGMELDDYLKSKDTRQESDPDDEFAKWHERFLHELTSEFGPLPEGEDEEALNAYIREMKRNFRLFLN